MEYNKIIAVTGLPGLYELLSSKADGAIVRSLDDEKATRFVASRIHNFSHLESIEVYTIRDNVNLVEILKAMETSTEKLPDEKDNASLKNYFTKVYPDLDFDRVYSSDLKKMVKWFTVLKANDIEIKLSEALQEEETPEEEVAVEEKPAPAPALKKKTEKAEKAEVKEVKTAADKTKAAVKEEAAEEEKPKAKKAAPTPAPALKKKAEKAEKTEEAAEEKKAPAPKKAAKKK